MLRLKLPRRGDDGVCGTDAERDADNYDNGSSGFGCNADRAEMADLGRAGEDRSPTHGYAATRENAMGAFAKSWRRL